MSEEEYEVFSDRRARRKVAMLAAFLLTPVGFLQFMYITTVVNTAPYNEPLMVNFTSNVVTTEKIRLEDSTCSLKASKRGPHQNVISFSFYGDPSNSRGYFAGIEINAQLLTKHYPNWVMRVYHDISDGAMNSTLIDLEQKYGQILDMCYVGSLPKYGSLLGSQQNMWRFMTLGDPLVDFTIFRDLDSNLNEREVEAVSEWIDSKYPMHLMRDNPKHKTLILAGMWGARLKEDENRQTWTSALKILLEAGKIAGKKGLDQEALAKHIWHLATIKKNFVMQHDSYYCNEKNYANVGGMRPYPTCRDMSETPNFVGARRNVDTKLLKEACPKSCRIIDSCTAC